MIMGKTKIKLKGQKILILKLKMKPINTLKTNIKLKVILIPK